MGLTPAVDAQQPSTTRDTLFQVSKLDKDAVPCPPLFADIVQSAFCQLGSLTTPSNLDKRLYCAASELDDILVLPTVDAPVAHLTTSSLTSTDPMDGLKSEEKKTEFSFCKAHEAAAWAVNLQP